MVVNSEFNPDISIINYGINNLKSVSMAFIKLGKSVQIIENPEDILSAKCLILPGIGAFGDGMEGLRKRYLIDPIKHKVNEGTPMLGICLGMQMLFTESEEFGIHEGLNLIPGKVIPFKKPSDVKIKGYKVPHMGWNELNKPKNKMNNIWENTLLSDIKEKSDVFFIHSFYPVPDDENNVLATSIHGNQEFCSVVKKNNVSGTQYHPEKSGKLGLQILKKFCELNEI